MWLLKLLRLGLCGESDVCLYSKRHVFDLLSMAFASFWNDRLSDRQILMVNFKSFPNYFKHIYLTL